MDVIEVLYDVPNQLSRIEPRFEDWGLPSTSLGELSGLSFEDKTVMSDSLG